MPTTPLFGLRYPSGTSPADVVTDLTNLATDVDNNLSGGIVASFNTTPNLLGVVGEVNVINSSFTPAVAGDYLFVAKCPFDVSSGTADAKLLLYVAGNVIDWDLRTGPGSVFVGYMRCAQSIDLTAVSTTVRTTIQRTSGAGTLNARSSNARVDVYRAGLAGILQ